jgi:hypothetical protein
VFKESKVNAKKLIQNETRTKWYKNRQYKDKPFWYHWQRGIKTIRSNPFRTTNVIEKDVKRYPDISEERRLRLRAFPTLETVVNKLLKQLHNTMTEEDLLALFTTKENDLLYYLQFKRHKIEKIDKEPK